MDATESAPTAASEPITDTHLGRGDRLGRYVIVGERGAGTMGVVYSAYDPELDRLVAVKILHADRERRGRARDRLIREARVLARLAHPNVVRVHDLGEVDGRTFIAMECVEGQTVRDWLASGRRTLAEILDVYLQAGRGLAAAHAAGIVHRDFKPSNAIVAVNGTVFVLDFGLARELVVDGDEASEPAESSIRVGPSVTATGALVGTPRYMAPECLLGRPADARSDQLSYCAALFEALYGMTPFGGDDLEELRRRATTGEPHPVAHATGVARRVHRILLRGLRRDPATRYPGMDALLAALERARRRPRTIAMGIGLALAMLGVLSFAFVGRAQVTCDGSEAKLAGVWDPVVRDAVGGVFQARDAAGAGEHTRFAAAMDRWSRAWTSSRREVCEATHVRGAQSEALLDVRMGCLDRQLDEALALTRSLRAQPSSVMTYRATGAALALAAPADCRDARAASAVLPPDITVRARVASVTQRLEGVRALRHLGETRRAADAIESVAADAEQTGFAPLLADAKLLSARLHIDRGGWRGAGADLPVVVREAARAGDDRMFAMGLQMLFLVAGKRLRHDQADALAPIAEAATLQHPGDLELQQTLAFVQGQVWEVRDPAVAREHFERALALARVGDGDRSVPVARALSRLADLDVMAGKLAEASGELAEARALLETTFGPQHPQVAAILVLQGMIAAKRGDLDAAEQLFARGLESHVRTEGPTAYRTLLANDRIAHTLCDAGRYAAGLRYFDEFLARLASMSGPAVPRNETTIEHRAECLAASLAAAI